MALIDQINLSISQMTNSELLERIKELRSARRVPTPIGGIKRSAKKPSEKLDLQALLSSIAPDELASLLAELED